MESTLVLLLIMQFLTQTRSFGLNRVVFQTFILSDGTSVQCYGTCSKDIEDPTEKLEKFNVSRCEGRKVRVACPIGFQIRIFLATLGRLNPVLEICNRDHKLLCLYDISNELRELCQKKHQCEFDVTNAPLKDRCGEVKYLSLDVKYTCDVQTTTAVVTTALTSMIPTTINSTSPQFTERYSPSPILVTKPFLTMEPIQKTPVVERKEDNKGMLWISAAYLLLTDKEFITKNRTHLILTVALSMFVGLVLYLCFLLDHCRRIRIRRAKKRRLEANQQLLDEEHPDGEHVDMQLNNIGRRMNGYVPKENEHRRSWIHNNNNNNNTNNNNNVVDIDEENLVSCSEAKIEIGDQHIENPYRIQSPSSFPPPPDELLVNSPASTSSNDLIPPPPQFSGGQKELPKFIITSPTPNGSFTAGRITRNSSNAASDNDIKHGGSYIFHKAESKSNVSNSDLIEENSPPSSSQLQRKIIDINKPGSAQLRRKFSLNEVDQCVSLPCVKFALYQKSMSNETVGDLVTLPNHSFKVSSKSAFTKPILGRQCSNQESPVFQTNKLYDRHKSQSATTSPPVVQRNPRSGRLHVIIPPHSERTRKDLNDQDRETITTPKHLCGSGHSHACICIPTRTKSGGYVCSCVDNDKCCVRACNEERTLVQYEHTELTDSESKAFIVEESGYHSHETGTDSICSSTRSTDLEDFTMFSPTSFESRQQLQNTKTKVSNKTRNIRRDPKLIALNAHKHIRRSKYDSRAMNQMRPSESSQDDGSSRDSVKMTRMKPKTKKREAAVNTELKRLVEFEMEISGSGTTSENKGILKSAGIFKDTHIL